MKSIKRRGKRTDLKYVLRIHIVRESYILYFGYTYVLVYDIYIGL